VPCIKAMKVNKKIKIKKKLKIKKINNKSYSKRVRVGFEVERLDWQNYFSQR
jgi:hypothetical protein